MKTSLPSVNRFGCGILSQPQKTNHDKVFSRATAMHTFYHFDVESRVWDVILGIRRLIKKSSKFKDIW